ncbi:MAG: hypothetical protein WBP42_12580 [Candidatus Zixiibacteriota bacterium]
MARIRQVKPEFFTDEELWKCDDLVILLFEGLWLIADKSGRLTDNIIFIHGNCLPHRPTANVDAMLNALHDRGFITRYSVKESKYIQINTFEKHQNVHPKEKPSIIPACRGKVAEKSRKNHDENADESRSTSFPSFPSTSTSTSTSKEEQEPSAPTENSNGKTPDQMRAELAPIFGWDGKKKKEVIWFDYLEASTQWLSGIYPHEPIDQIKTNAGRIIKNTARNAFGKPDSYHKSWPPVAAFLAFLHLAIGEPQDGGGLLSGRTYPPNSALMIRNVNQVFTDGQQTHEHAHAAYHIAGLV